MRIAALISRFLGLAHFRVVYDAESQTFRMPYNDAKALAAIFHGTIVFNPPPDDDRELARLASEKRIAIAAAQRLREATGTERVDAIADIPRIMHAAAQEIQRLRDLTTVPKAHSGYDALKHAEALIRTLPPDHDGRNTWLLNCGTGPDVEAMRDAHPTYRKRT